MRRPPYRPKNDSTISQPLSDGLLTVYSVSDKSAPGRLPSEQLTLKIKLPYAEQRLGVTRYYAAMQNQIQIDRVLRVPRAGSITTQDVAITEDGQQYRIDLVQSVAEIMPPCVDLTLTIIKQRYNV